VRLSSSSLSLSLLVSPGADSRTSSPPSRPPASQSQATPSAVPPSSPRPRRAPSPPLVQQRPHPRTPPPSRPRTPRRREAPPRLTKGPRRRRRRSTAAQECCPSGARRACRSTECALARGRRGGGGGPCVITSCSLPRLYLIFLSSVLARTQPNREGQHEQPRWQWYMVWERESSRGAREGTRRNF